MQCVNNESGRFPHTSSCTSSSSNSNHHHHHHNHHPHRHDHNSNNNHTSTSTSTQSPPPPPAPAPPLAPHQEQPPPHEKQTHSSSSTLTTHSSSSSSRPSHPLPHIPSESSSDVKRASALTALSLQSDAVVDDDADDDDVITTHHLIADNSRVHDEYRVKVWLLSDDGHWTDDGTGHCLFKLVDSPPAQKYVDFRIFSESSSASSAPLLLHHTMHAHTLYDKQGESIIQWIETGDTAECEETRGEKCAREYAISFQHKSHCQRVWRLIAHLKGFARLSEFEQHVRLRRTKVSSTSPLVADDDDDGDGEDAGGDKMAMDAMDVDGNDDDDDVDELLNTFLSDHVRVDDESNRGRNRDQDMDINVTDEKLSRTASGTILENASGTDTTTAIGQKTSKRKFRLKKKKTKTKKLKLKNQKFKTAALSSSDDDDDDEQDDDDDDDDRFLHKLNKRTLRKNKTPKQQQTQQHRQRLQIPLPTAHNLCHVYAAVRTATETCDVGAIDQLADRRWMCALYDVFVALEREQKQKQNMQNTPKEAETTTTTTAVDIDMFPERSQNMPQTVSATKCNDLSTPSKNGNGAHETETENELEQKTTTTTAMATTAWTASSLTPRLSCTSLSTLPPSVEDDPRDEYHALEFVFLIVLECCREHTLIKRHHPHHAATTAAATAANRVSAKFAEIGQQTPMFMHSLVASLLGSFGADARHGGNGGGTALCMLYLSKPWVAKTIAMLEYDPVRRRHLRHCSRNVPGTGTGTCPPLPPPPPPLETPESVVPPEAYTSQIALSYKHRHFLRRAKPQRLSIPFSTDGEEAEEEGEADGDTLYDEIEYLYLLTYARDVVLLGKLDLEQQAFHFLNHHVARYNQCVCECIVDDAAFLRVFLLQLKQSCCTYFGSDKIAPQDLKPALIARKSKSSTVSIHDTPPLTPQTSPGPNGDVDTKHKPANGDGEVDVDDVQTETAMAMATTQMVHMEDTCRELGIDADDDDDDDDDDDGYARALSRRRHNRHELFSAPNGVEFRFLSELLSRIKLVDVSARSALYADLLAAGLLDTLTACIQHCELLPTAQYAHIWLVAVEAVHHMMSGSLYTQTTPIRAQLCSQIDRLEAADDHGGGDGGDGGDHTRRRPTLLQRLCAAFSATYECADDGILQQIYFVLVGVLGLGDALTLESAAQSSFYMGLHHPNHNRTQQNAQLMRIAAHFFRDCVPHFFDVLNQSNAEAQVQTRQKFVLRLLSACCEQELFVPLLKHVETEFSLLTCVEKLIFVPPSKAPSTGPTSSATSSTPPFSRSSRSSRSRVPNVDVSLCSIRFLRDTIHLSQHDVFWSDRLRSANAFGRMMALFECNGVDTDNMLNSTILSVFASIEDKKIQDMVLYLGEEQILQTYDAKVAYTTLFGELLQLYENARIGLSIATQLDDGSTATLSNCSSLSPRRELSPPNAAAAASSDAGDAHARRKRGYSLVADDGGDGAGGDREIHYLDGFDDDGADVGVKHGSKKEEQPVDTPRPPRKERPATNASMSMSCGVSATATAIYQDSPRPAAHGDGGDGGSRELRLPKRHKVDVEFDLLCNAKKKQRSPKPKLMSLRIAHENGVHSKTDEENHEMDIKSGDGDGDGLFVQRRKNSKRKYEEISPSPPHQSNGEDDHRHHREHGHSGVNGGTSADYFSDRFEFAQTMSSSDGIHATFCDEIPPKKKAKLNGDRNGGSTSPHASPRPYLPLSPPSSILLNGADPTDAEVLLPKHVHFESNSAVQSSQAQVQVRDTDHIETAHDRDHSTKENDDDGISSSSSPTTRSSAVCQT